MFFFIFLPLHSTLLCRSAPSSPPNLRRFWFFPLFSFSDSAEFQTQNFSSIITWGDKGKICSFLSPPALLLRVDGSVFWIWHLSSAALPKVLLSWCWRLEGRNLSLLLNCHLLSIAILSLLGSAAHMPVADQLPSPLSDQTFNTALHKTRESSLEQLQVHPHCTVPCAGNSGPGCTSSNCSQLSDPAEQPTASWCPVPRGPSSWGRNGEEASDNNVFQSPSGPWEDPLHFRPSKPCRCGLQHYLLSLSCHHSSLIVFPMLIYKGYFNKYHLSQWPIRGRLSFFQLPSVSISESLEPSLPWFWKCAGSQCTSKDVNYCNNYWFSKISMLSSTFLRQARLGLAAARLTRKLILTNRTEVEMMYFTRMIWETQDGRAADGIISI